MKIIITVRKYLSVNGTVGTCNILLFMSETLYLLATFCK